jgi:hypothetical protein
MSLLIFALVVLLIAVLCVYVLRLLSPDDRLTNIGTIVILIVVVIIIVQRSGVL